MSIIWFLAFVAAVGMWLWTDNDWAKDRQHFLRALDAADRENARLHADNQELRARYLRVVHPSSRGVAQFDVFKARRTGFDRTLAEVRSLPEIGGDAS